MSNPPQGPSYPQQPGYPRQPGYPQPGYPPQPAMQPVPPRNRTPILIGVIVGLAIVLVGVAALFWLNRSGEPKVAVTTSPSRIGPATTAPTQPTTQPTTQSTATVTSKVTVTQEAPTATVTQSGPVVTVTQSGPVVTVTQQTTQPPPPQTVWPPAGATLCDNWVAVNESTSCSFAYNVAGGFYTYGPGIITAYSPVTDRWYDMSCSAIAASVVKCTGGNNAVVYIRQ